MNAIMNQNPKKENEEEKKTDFGGKKRPTLEVKKGSVHPTLVGIILRIAEEWGANPYEICNKAKIPYPLAYESDDPKRRISEKKYAALWEAVDSHVNVKNFSLHFSEGEFDRIGNVVSIIAGTLKNSSTIKEGLEAYSEFQGILSNVISPRISIKGEFLSIVWAPLNPNFVAPPVLVDSLLSYTLYLVNHISPKKDLFPEYVRFPHSAPSDIKEHKKFFRSPLIFGETDIEILFKKEYGDLAIPFANKKLLQFFGDHAKSLLIKLNRFPWSNKVAARFINEFEKEDPETLRDRTTLKYITRNVGLGKGTKTLQNRLNEEEKTFNDIKSEVRFTLAKDMLVKYDSDGELQYRIEDVAYELGFSDQGNFSKSFKEDSGMPPGRYRAMNS